MNGFLCKDIKVENLIGTNGDRHHIFPKQFLISKGLTRKHYNSVANFVYTDTSINIKIGKQPPAKYMGTVLEQCKTGEPIIGRIISESELRDNLKSNCIPYDFVDYNLDDFEMFLEERRKLIAKRLKEYYFSL